MSKTINIKINEESSNYMERLFLEYTARKDIIASVFEAHKYDSDYAVLESAPFKHYENLFAESKIAYETALRELEVNFIPEEYRLPSSHFVVDFNEKTIVLTVNE